MKDIEKIETGYADSAVLTVVSNVCCQIKIRSLKIYLTRMIHVPFDFIDGIALKFGAN